MIQHISIEYNSNNKMSTADNAINTSNQAITNTDESKSNISNATVAYSVFQSGRNVVNVPILHTE
jgi:hypothetical protein